MDPRQPIVDVDCEQALLGGLLVDSKDSPELASVQREAMAVVRGDMLSLIQHRDIYQGLESLRAECVPIDLMTLADRLKTEGKLESVGGSQYLVDLGTCYTDPWNVAYHAKIIRRKWELREIGTIGYHLIEDVYSPTAEPSEIIDRFVAKLRRVEPFDDGKEVDWCDLVVKLPGWLTNAKTSAVSSDCHQLDDATGGFDPFTLTVLGARPSVGKSAVALQWCFAAVQQKRKALFVSVEMNERTVALRGVAATSQIVTSVLKRDASPDDLRHYADVAARKLPRGHLFFLTGVSRVDHVCAAIRRIVRKHKIGFIVIDHFHDLTPMRSLDTQYREYAESAHTIKLMAQELEAHTVLVSQLKRDNDKSSRFPRLDDLRGCGDLEQKADYVIFLYRDPTQDRQVGSSDTSMDMTMLLAKNRNGPLTQVIGRFHKTTMRFESQAIYRGGYVPEAVGDEFPG